MLRYCTLKKAAYFSFFAHVCISWLTLLQFEPRRPQVHKCHQPVLSQRSEIFTEGTGEETPTTINKAFSQSLGLTFKKEQGRKKSST